MQMFDRMNQVFAEIYQGRTLKYLSSQQGTQHKRMRRALKNHQDDIRSRMLRGQTKLAAVAFDNFTLLLNKHKPPDISFVYIDSK